MRMCSLLSLMRKQATGQSMTDGIKAAPARTALAMFGGSMSIAEFRADSCNSNTCLKEMPRNFILDTPVLTLVPSLTPRLTGGGSASSKNLRFDNLTPGVRNETLRLRRPKPIKSKANNIILEKIFCIS
jgi:hypothetical protein